MSTQTRTRTYQGLFLADVDGTLLTPTKEVTARARAAIHAIREAGLAFTIVSSRPPRGITFLIKPLGLEIPCASFNGGTMIRPDLTIEKQRVLPKSIVEQAIEIVATYKADLWVYASEKWYVRDSNAPHVQHEQDVLQFTPTVVKDFQGLTSEVNKLVAVSDDRSLIQSLQGELQKKIGHKSSATFSQDFYIDITPLDANKGTVVEDLCEFLSIPASSVVTIGDMQNDVLMFKKSGFSIAMGNARDDVKASADYITDRNDNEGFAKAVDYFLKNHPTKPPVG